VLLYIVLPRVGKVSYYNNLVPLPSSW